MVPECDIDIRRYRVAECKLMLDVHTSTFHHISAIYFDDTVT